ncbi:MAG: EcoKI restriction-modification system protein HsdS [Bacteroidetes bacterium ADurb.Bin302]|nr:MAG: EcoKI restriction-modification system protein HsdS [Bacteroidetes bacterium ADurb.Bin302]
MKIKLSQILSSLESGGRPKGGASLDNKGIPSLGAEHLDSNGGFNFKSVKYIPEDYFNGLKNGIIEKENILIVKDGATTGKVSFVTEDFPFETASVNEHVFLLKIDKSKAFPRFAFQYLKCPQGQRDIMRDFRGATVGGISRGFVDFVKFELPPFPDQLHIANLLSKAENLIAQRKESIRLLDEFLKSKFLEIFGDPVKNEKGWAVCNLSDLGSLDRGVSKARPRNLPELLGGIYPLIQTGDVTNAGIYITKYKQTYSELGLKQSKLWPKGTMLITIAANIAQTSILSFDACFPDSVVGFVTNTKKARVLYVHFLFKFFQALLESKASQTAQKNINLDILRNLKVPCPPIELQSQFTKIVEKTESLKTQYQQSLQELENLYGSLSQKAFRGELMK